MNRRLRVAALLAGGLVPVAAGGQNGAVAPAAPPTAVKPQQQAPPWLAQILKQVQGAQALKPVPNLAGMTQNQASAALEKAGLKGTFFNTDHTDWRVAGQNPVSGDAKAGSNVDVTMGPMVPGLGGMTLDAAAVKLKATGLQLGDPTREGVATAVQLIARQSPQEGTYALPGSGVAVWLPPPLTKTATNDSGTTGTSTTGSDVVSGSTGSDGTQGTATNDGPKMPSVLTLSYKQAASQLATLGVAAVPFQKVTRGTVQAQSVAVGSPVQRGERVTLTMGIVVPDVEGLTPADAEQQLGKVGLHGVYDGGVMHLPGMTVTVVQQVPEAQTVVTTNLTVTLFAKNALGPVWWLVGVAVLGLAGWSAVKIVKSLVPVPPAEFSAKVNQKAVKVAVAPTVAFELRAKRGAGEVRTLRSPQVKSVNRGSNHD